MRDNEYNQSKVAYEDGPKEVNYKRGLHNGNRQFGNADKMPQENRGYRQRYYPANPPSPHNYCGLDVGRHKEYR